MSNPDGPTGVITLKKVGDVTYEQYGTIVLNTTGLTQVTASSAVLGAIFQPNIEQQMTWIEDFSSRIQGAPHQVSQSSLKNSQAAAWTGGAWSTQGNTSSSLVPQATLSGSVSLHLTTGGVALPDAEFSTNESDGNQQMTSHVSRNPTFYMRWAQTAATSSGAVCSIGWHRGSEGFTNPGTLLGGIYFRAQANSDILAVCVTRVGATQFETTKSMGVLMAPGVYHTGRLVVTGGGTNVECFIDGVSKGSITTNIPTEGGTFALVPGLGATNANVDLIDVDYMACSQQRTP